MILKDFAALDGVYKLHPDAAGLMGRVLKRADMRPDLSRMSCEIVLTKEIEDRSGDIVIVKGIDLADHKRHPVALFNHDKDAPIGRFEDPSGLYTVKSVGDTLVGELFFNQKSAFAHDVFECVVDKTFTAASIGFLPVVGNIEKRMPRGTRYGAARLVEGSIVTIGDNPHAGIQAIHKAMGRANASDVFKQYLMPLAGDRPASVVGGFDTKREKGMGRDDDQNPDLSAAEDEFLPPDDDPNADPNGDPHADHKQVVDQAVEDMLASIYTKFTQGSIDLKGAVKLFKECLSHHGKVSELNGGDGEDEGFGDEDAEGDDEFGDSFDEDNGDEGDDADSSDSSDKPDLEDKAKKKAEKAVATMWTKSYAPVMTATAEGLAHIVAASDPDARKIQKYAKQLLDRMGRAPGFHGLVTKALADVESPWADWEEAFRTKGNLN
jgi:hypothetical protein